MARELRRDQLGTHVQAMTAYGDVVRLVAGPPGRRARFHLVTHPDGVQQVLAGNAGNYVKDSRFYRELAAAVGDGLLTSDGERWRRQRRTLAPLFAHGRIGGYVPVMADEAVRLRRRWDAGAGSPAGVDLHAETVEYTLRVVGRALFGTDLDEVAPTIRATFPMLSQQVRRRATATVPRPGRRLTGAQRALYATVDAIVERRRRAAGDHDGDLVSLLLAARDPQTGAPLSTQEVRDQLLIFLIAGHETTATALTFTWHLLGRHPDVQRRVHQELDGVLGGQVPTAGDVPRLAYTAMAVKEALRLYPPGRRLRPAQRGRRPDRRPPHPGPLGGGAQPVGHPPPARLLAGPGAVRPRPVRPGRGVRAAPLRLVPLWRRPPRLHRGPVRAHRGGGGHRGRARRPRAALRRRARAADHRDHPAPRGPGLVPGGRQATGCYGAGGGPTISRPYLR
jgi:cytochrome P450